jgi:hypothetical protein
MNLDQKKRLQAESCLFEIHILLFVAVENAVLRLTLSSDLNVGGGRRQSSYVAKFIVVVGYFAIYDGFWVDRFLIFVFWGFWVT